MCGAGRDDDDDDVDAVVSSRRRDDDDAVAAVANTVAAVADAVAAVAVAVVSSRRTTVALGATLLLTGGVALNVCSPPRGETEEDRFIRHAAAAKHTPDPTIAVIRGRQRRVLARTAASSPPPVSDDVSSAGGIGSVTRGHTPANNLEGDAIRFILPHHSSVFLCCATIVPRYSPYYNCTEMKPSFYAKPALLRGAQ